MNYRNGVLYIAVGEEYVREAKVSALSIKRVMDTHISIMTNKKYNSMGIFDNVIKLNNPKYKFGDQICNLMNTPYEKTVYLDTDTYIEGDISCLFDMLDRFTFCASHNVTNYASEKLGTKYIQDIPKSFPELNTGVLPYNKNKKMSNFVERWKSEFQRVYQEGQPYNQAAFRKAVYESDVRFSVLPREYNCLFRQPGSVTESVKIFHGRLLKIVGDGASKELDVEQAIETINKFSGPRAYYNVGGEVRLASAGKLSFIYNYLRNKGLSAVITRLKSKVLEKFSIE